MAGAPRRSYGTGSLYVRTDAAGGQAWYGRWYVGSGRVKRRIGPKRQSGSRDGLTRAQAERELRRRVEAERTSSPIAWITVGDAGEALLRNLEALGRKPTTLMTYRSLLRTHLVRVGEKPLDRITVEDIETLVASIRRDGAGPKTTRNALALLHQVFAYGQRKRWCQANPCAEVERPTVEENADIHFLDQDELDALLRAVPDGPFSATDHAIFLTAAMTGLRQGELLAMRWRDVDWSVSRIRVRQNYVRGHWGTPKTRRGIRSVPMADRVARELERHFQRSAYQDDDDLVFCHPQIGGVLDHSQLVRRYKKGLVAAGVRPVRFNDLRHTFGTRMAAAGVPLRTLQEWMGHRDIKTTQIYADYQPDDRREADLIERAFTRGPVPGPNLSETELTEPT